MARPDIYWEARSGKTYGYWIHKIGDSFKDEAGNYIYAKETQPRTWQPFYIGQTSSLADRLADHEKEDCAKRNGATHVHAHTTPSGETQRKAEEADLIARMRRVGVSRRPRRLCVRLWWIAVFPVIGCGESVANLALADGSRLGSRIVADTAIVFIIDPATCFTCDRDVIFWLDWIRQDSAAAFVVTREPTADEWFQFRLNRLTPDAVLARPLLRGGTVALFIEGQPVLTGSAAQVRRDPIMRDLLEQRNR
jgi:hypothetical protein